MTNKARRFLGALTIRATLYPLAVVLGLAISLGLLIGFTELTGHPANSRPAVTPVGEEIVPVVEVPLTTEQFTPPPTVQTTVLSGREVTPLVRTTPAQPTLKPAVKQAAPVAVTTTSLSGPATLETPPPQVTHSSTPPPCLPACGPYGP